jgi:hypothetical protein
MTSMGLAAVNLANPVIRHEGAVARFRLGGSPLGHLASDGASRL